MTDTNKKILYSIWLFIWILALAILLMTAFPDKNEALKNEIDKPIVKDRIVILQDEYIKNDKAIKLYASTYKLNIKKNKEIKQIMINLKLDNNCRLKEKDSIFKWIEFTWCKNEIIKKKEIMLK